MASQVENGKGFEWAVGLALIESGFSLIPNSASEQNLRCFNKANLAQKNLFRKNARKAIAHILMKEEVNIGRFEYLSDGIGQDGDVRDIVIHADSREVGVSCKTNHGAYKHSRLSDNVDFVKKWGLNPDGWSLEYEEVVRDIFGRLRNIKKESLGSALWKDQPDVPNDYYWPVLDAFEKEIKRVESPSMCSNLVRYLVGNHDFYKVVSRKNMVEILGFNLFRSLNVAVLKLPDKIIGIRSNNGSQFAKTITFNNGWEFNFRIHNASSKVEPSLKFDITATALPPKLYQHHLQH